MATGGYLAKESGYFARGGVIIIISNVYLILVLAEI